MSQSKSISESNAPKDSARTHRRRPDVSDETTNGESASEPEPACRSRSVGHSIESREWREIPYDDRLRAFYEACSWSECYPDGPPDASDTETVVRSSRHPTVYHRPQETTASCDSLTEQHDHGDSKADRAATVRESIGVVTELRDGDNVIWSGVSTSAEVVETTTDPNGVVNLVGAKGSEYRLEGRPECARSFYIQHFGCKNEIARIVPADGRPEGN
jgi:hypothetical protein